MKPGLYDENGNQVGIIIDMDENDSSERDYTNGVVALEIEHLLAIRLHPLNTLKELESLKERIHGIMSETFSDGRARAAMKTYDQHTP